MQKQGGIRVTDSFQLLQNYRQHRRNQQAIMARKPKEASQPPRPPRPLRSSRARLRYRPFLNYNSSLVSIGEYYRPTNRLSSLRIFNENVNHADRLERIRLKPTVRDPPLELTRSSFPRAQRERQVQLQNVEIARRILETRSLQIDFKHFSREFDQHREWSRLRSNIGKLSTYSQLSPPPISPLRLQFGTGRSGLRFILEELSFRGFIPKPDDTYVLEFKFKGTQRFKTGLLTVEQLLRWPVTVRTRHSPRTMRLAVCLLQFKGTRENLHGRFVVKLREQELRDGSWREKEAELSKGVHGQGVVRMRVQGWLARTRPPNMRECDEQYESSEG